MVEREFILSAVGGALITLGNYSMLICGNEACGAAYASSAIGFMSSLGLEASSKSYQMGIFMGSSILFFSFMLFLSKRKPYDFSSSLLIGKFSNVFETSEMRFNFDNKLIWSILIFAFSVISLFFPGSFLIGPVIGAIAGWLAAQKNDTGRYTAKYYEK